MKWLINFLFLIILGSSILGSAFFLSKYIPYLIQNIKSQKTTQSNNNNSSLIYLEELTKIPIIGQFFYQQRIFKLAEMGQWQAIVNQSSLALSGIYNKNIFSIWYHKGLAECILKKSQQCYESALMANYLASGSIYEHKVYAHQLYKISLQANQKKFTTPQWSKGVLLFQKKQPQTYPTYNQLQQL